MSDEIFINSDQIVELFQLLKNNNIDYVLLRNMNNELPYKLRKKKDIDILINPAHKGLLNTILVQNGWFKLDHPWDFGNNFKFLYSMDQFLMFKKSDLHLDVCFQMSCRSLNDGEWIPLDESIQKSSFQNKREVESPWLYELSYEDELIHLVTRSIFDKKKFESPYIERIEFLISKIKVDSFSEKCEKVFFKFSSSLISLIEQKKFSEIRIKYLSFKDY